VLGCVNSGVTVKASKAKGFFIEDLEPEISVKQGNGRECFFKSINTGRGVVLRLL
jgi:hypothetical protein